MLETKTNLMFILLEYQVILHKTFYTSRGPWEASCLFYGSEDQKSFAEISFELMADDSGLSSWVLMVQIALLNFNLFCHLRI